jgi:lipoyl(octanoyl) transferase
MPRPDGAAAGWATSQRPIDYPAAVAAMHAHVEAMLEDRAGEMVWLLEHPPLYTAGVSAKPADLLDPGRFPVFETERGGQFTYHGPGQRVVYVMLDLRERGRDVRRFVQALEGWVIDVLAEFGVRGELKPGRVGVWVERDHASQEDKIAALGVKLRRWVSFHGISLNVSPALEHFSGIVPCGQALHGVTSLADLGIHVDMADVDRALKSAFERIFGPVQNAPAPL